MIARRHYTLVGLIGLIIAVFALQQAFDAAIVARFSTIPIQITAAFQALAAGDFSPTVGTALGRLLTSAFVHADIEHLAMNLVFLWAFGFLVSEHLSALAVLVAFVVTAVAGSVAQVLLNQTSMIPIIGASGALSGFEGLYLGLALRWRMDWPDVWPLAQPVPPLQLAAFGVAGFLFDLYSLMNHDQGIAYGAHIGGFVAGLAIAIALTTVYPTEKSFAESRFGRGPRR